MRNDSGFGLNNPFGWKFRHQLSLLIGVAMLCLALLGAMMTSWGASEALQRNLINQGAQVTTSFAGQAILALIYGSGDNAMEEARITLGFPGVSHVAIYYPNGDALLEEGARVDWKPVGLHEFDLVQLDAETASLAHETDTDWHFVAQVYEPESLYDLTSKPKTLAGYVHVVVTKDMMYAMRKDIFVRNLQSTLLVAVVLLLLLPLLASRMTRPLNQLARLMRRAEQGEAKVRIKPHGAEEIRNMGRAFNLMMETLEQRSRRLDMQNQDLLEQIRERERVEHELRDYRDHLQELVDAQTHDLIVARDAALAGERAMSTFVANMSHEIRTPLTAMLGFSESLQIDQLSQEERAEAVRRIMRSGRHLLKIINDILDLSKISAQQIEVEQMPVAPLDILADVVGMEESLARAKGIDLNLEYHFPLPRRIVSDALRVKQILLNLLSNAIKFTVRGEVRVCVSFDPVKAELCYQVIDTGIGIAAEQQARLFDPFTQADVSTTRKYGGTGLGLHIAQHFARRLGGDIRVTSRLGEGSCFALTIATGLVEAVDLVTRMEDVPDAHSAEPQQSAPVTIQRLRGKILLAEDNPDNQDLIRMYIRRLGADVELAENGEQAIEMALADEYDLILMDMQMPVMDGLAAVQLLRQAGYRAPIVAITANAMRDDEARYRAAGCDDFISKPIALAEFNATLDHYLVISAVSGTHEAQAKPFATGLQEDAAYVELVGRFRSRLPAVRQEIRRAFEIQNWSRLLDLVHDLKGMGSSFGYPQLTEYSAEIQVRLKEHAYSSLAKLVASLDAAIGGVLLVD